MKPTRQTVISALVASTAFCSGFALMVLEMFGVRVLAPYFGTGMSVWGAIISVIMSALGFGYAFGGKVADKRPSFLIAALLISPTAVSLILFPLYANLVCGMVDAMLSDRRVAALLCAALIFPLPVFFLGAVSPLLVKLKVRSLSEVGDGSGMVYAFGTAGGVAGTLTSVFVLLGSVPSGIVVFSIGLFLFVWMFVLLFSEIPIENTFY